MSEFIPRRPTGTTPEAIFDESSHDKVHGPRGKWNNTSTVKVNRTTKGNSLHIRPARKKGGTGSVNYQGTYDPTKTYKKGDIVRVQVGTSQGIWICVSDTPTSVAPVFPEPASLPVPGVNVWEMFAFGIQVTAVCSSGNKIVYMNSSAPS